MAATDSTVIYFHFICVGGKHRACRLACRRGHIRRSLALRKVARPILEEDSGEKLGLGCS